MKFDALQPWQLKATMGGNPDDPNCWPDPDDDNGGIKIPGGPTIPIPGMPPYGG